MLEKIQISPPNVVVHEVGYYWVSWGIQLLDGHLGVFL